MSTVHIRKIPAFALLLALYLGAAPVTRGEDPLDLAVKRYREALKDASPAELWVDRGEALFRARRGPKNASLESCDFGLGPGVVKGAHAQLPRYFADSGKVEDLESRLITCMALIQGIAADAFPRHARTDPERMADFDAIASYIVSQSNGMKLAAPLTHQKEIEAYRLGEALFYRRAGTHDFSCSTCHTQHGKRIRLQKLPHLTDPTEAREVFPSWPAYRVAAGEVHTMQTWIATCLWQMRFPQVRYGSEATVALQVFMAQQANGGVIAAPSIKR